MKIVKGSVATRYVGSKVRFEFEMPDEATDEDIEEAAQQAMWDEIDFWYEVVEG